VDALVTLANACYVTAYFVRSVIWLRVFALSGACCLALYFYTLPQPLMNVVYWNLFYVGINVAWIGRLLWVRPDLAGSPNAKSRPSRHKDIPQPAGETVVDRL